MVYTTWSKSISWFRCNRYEEVDRCPFNNGFEQSLLFEEPQESQEGNLRESENKNSEEEKEEIIVAEHKRKKRGRRPLPPEFECVDIVHDLSKEER
jgi:hypothetical protein